jgi:hypothetical protein
MKRFGIYIIICVFLIFAVTPFAKTDAAAVKAKVVSVGEEIVYEVSFLGVKLGTIKITTYAKESVGNKQAYKMVGNIDSYASIPFVDLHNISTGWIDPSLTFSHKFTSVTNTKGSSTVQTILYDYDKGQVTNRIYKDGNLDFSKDYKRNDKSVDGMGLFFLARRMVHSKRTIDVPTIMDKDFEVTTLKFTDKKENVTIDACSYPIRTTYFSGIADWTGIYGLTGNFEGWFSDDDACVPIKAKMKVYVGNINIELISWKRAGWTPPKGS